MDILRVYCMDGYTEGILDGYTEGILDGYTESYFL